MEIQGKQRRMEELQQMLQEPVATDAEIAHMNQQQQAALRAVNQLEERKRATLNDPDDKLSLFQQQANLVAKKKEAVLQRLSSVSRERSEVGHPSTTADVPRLGHDQARGAARGSCR